MLNNKYSQYATDRLRELRNYERRNEENNRLPAGVLEARQPQQQIDHLEECEQHLRNRARDRLAERDKCLSEAADAKIAAAKAKATDARAWADNIAEQNTLESHAKTNDTIMGKLLQQADAHKKRIKALIRGLAKAASETPDPVFTLEDVKHALRPVLENPRRGGRPRAVEILAEFGVDHTSKIDPKDFAAVIKACGP